MNYYRKYTPYLFLLPAAAVLIVFFFIPFFQTFYLSFFDYSSSIYNPTFNGLDNYIKLFREPVFYKVMFNTSSFSGNVSASGCDSYKSKDSWNNVI